MFSTKPRRGTEKIVSRSARLATHDYAVPRRFQGSMGGRTRRWTGDALLVDPREGLDAVPEQASSSSSVLESTNTPPQRLVYFNGHLGTRGRSAPLPRPLRPFSSPPIKLQLSEPSPSTKAAAHLPRLSRGSSETSSAGVATRRGGGRPPFRRAAFSTSPSRSSLVQGDSTTRPMLPYMTEASEERIQQISSLSFDAQTGCMAIGLEPSS
ncbi:hypothetical protein BCR35DRAFT_158669 [Leucosporidium creatinivorum]|uniref:Uncharacterized protein n=1 Tax=Leucosporidium creatinivorum TaxID=106004 RepID=A0A1Y2G1U2_9BASI|nr:hypothetical protein BCR35DRAFT_158669 [Leucosporidium creatinivorum]